MKDYIIEVPDFPIKGVSFKDISPLIFNVLKTKLEYNKSGLLI